MHIQVDVHTQVRTKAWAFDVHTQVDAIKEKYVLNPLEKYENIDRPWAEHHRPLRA